MSEKCNKCHDTGTIHCDEVFGTMVEMHSYPCSCEAGKARKPKTDKEIIEAQAKEIEELKAKVAELEAENEDVSKTIYSETENTCRERNEKYKLHGILIKAQEENQRMREALTYITAIPASLNISRITQGVLMVEILEAVRRAEEALQGGIA